MLATSNARSIRDAVRFIRTEWIIASAFAIVYALISLVNHANFRTYALDLGFYSNACWSYGHFIWPHQWMFGDGAHMLADHFDLHLILWSPLTWLFGGYTLLIVQIIAVAIGGIGMNRCVVAATGDRMLAAMAQVCLVAFFGTVTPFGFDFHSNVVAVMGVPWYMLALREGRVLRSWWIMLFIISAKENLGLWMAVVALCTIGLGSIRGVHAKVLIAQAVMALAWSATVITWLMPALDPDGVYRANADYAILGNGLGEMVVNLFSRPWFYLQALFMDMLGADPLGTAIKQEFHMLLLLAGGWALLLRWPLLIMALPLLAQKMYNEDPGKWGLFNQYNIEFAVLLPLAVFTVLARIRRRSLRFLSGVLALSGTLAATVHSLDFPIAHSRSTDREHDHLRFYQARHYHCEFDRSAVRDALALIPPDSPVSACTQLVPHVAAREHAFAFPTMGRAEHLIFLRRANSYPLPYEDYLGRVDQLLEGGEWRIIFDRADVVVLERGPVRTSGTARP